MSVDTLVGFCVLELQFVPVVVVVCVLELAAMVSLESVDVVVLELVD